MQRCNLAHFSKWIFVALSIVMLLAVTVVYSNNHHLPAQDKSANSGTNVNTSFYLEMRDGVRIAIDVWLPHNLGADDTVPTLVKATRYGRSQHTSQLYELLIQLGIYENRNKTPNDIKVFTDNGYAVVVVDARGSGASFGSRPVEWSRDEIEDYRQVIDWVISQPWSNRKVGAYGVSYAGNTAEMIAGLGHPAVKAIAPLYSYFDPYSNLIRPGGQFNQQFLKRWSNIVYKFDRGELCKPGTLKCWWVQKLSKGVKPVDADTTGSTLDLAIAERRNANVYDAIYPVKYRDNPYGGTNVTIADRSPYKYADKLDASEVAILAWVGLYDSATVDGALSRYATLHNSQQLIISPFTHGGRHDSDPFAATDKPVSITNKDFYKTISRFFDAHLKQAEKNSVPAKQIYYYTLGEHKWKTARQWPPQNTEYHSLFFNNNAQLSRQAPTTASGNDLYVVDYSATSGQHSRWHTISGHDVHYTSLNTLSAKTRNYTSQPISADMEITGNAELELFVASSEPECAIHAYLLAVSPKDEITYLTEGILKCSHRRVSSKLPVYNMPGPYHSHMQADAARMPVNKTENIRLSLFAVSVLVPKGYRLRVAISGNDADIFEQPTNSESHSLTIERNRIHPSHIVIPVANKATNNIATSMPNITGFN